MKKKHKSNRAYKRLKNQFRGLVAKLRSRKFDKGRPQFSSMSFRRGIQALYLSARHELSTTDYLEFLNWVSSQQATQLKDIIDRPANFEELSGVISDAPIVTLETEIAWLANRIQANKKTLAEFRNDAEIVESLTFNNRISDAIEKLKSIDKKFGNSLWSVQLRIALEHRLGGLEGQKRYVAEVRKVYRRGLLSFIAHNTSVRNEDKTTLSKYTSDIKTRIETHRYYDTSVKSYVLYRLTGQWPNTERGIADVLRIEQSHTLIDIYETFVSALQQLAKLDRINNKQFRLSKWLSNILEINDFRIRKLYHTIEPSFVSSLPDRSTEISDHLFKGEVDQAILLIKRERKNSLDIWHLVYSFFALSHLKNTGIFETVFSNCMPPLIVEVTQRSESKDQAIANCKKMAINLSGLTLSAGLVEIFRQAYRTEPTENWQPWAIGLNSPTLGIEDAPLGSIPFTSNFTGTTSEAWRNFHSPRKIFAPGAFFSAFSAMGYIARGEFIESKDLLLSEPFSHSTPPIRALTALLLLHAYTGLGDRPSAISLIANECTKDRLNQDLLPIAESLKNFTQSDFRRTKEPLDGPIALHLLWLQTEESATATLLRSSLRSFLKLSGAGVPSKLDTSASTYPTHQILYFLNNVCTPSFLDVCRDLRGSRAVLEERQSICALLGEIDPASSDSYQDETYEIAGQLLLDDGQYIVDRTRIHVDDDGLNRWAEREIAEDYARYKDLMKVDVEVDHNFDEVINDLYNELSSNSILVADSEADIVLISLLSRIKDEFLTNSSFGFDFYLSQRIRHQSFISAVRSHLEFAQLITTKDSRSGLYHRNNFWLSKFSETPENKKKLIDDALINFSRSFDSALLSAKDELLQVKSTEKPKGLLTLTLSPQLISIAKSIVSPDYDLRDFVNLATMILWAALEPSLAQAREYISKDLKEDITTFFDSLKASVKDVAEADPAFLEFSLATGQQSTAVQRSLDDVSAWFTRQDMEAQKKLFELDQVMNIVIDTTKKYQRGFEPIIESNIVNQDNAPCLLAAGTLVFVHDVLLVAFSNAKSYSGLKRPRIYIDVNADVALGTLEVSVKSECRNPNRAQVEGQLEEIREVIKSEDFGRRTRGEGRTGFLKLAAVVRQSKKGRIEFGFTDEKWFNLSVTYSMVVQKLPAEVTSE